MKSPIELLPCPFCGKQPKKTHCSTTYSGEQLVSLGCCAHIFSVEDDAISRWNKRTPIAPKSEEKNPNLDRDISAALDRFRRDDCSKMTKEEWGNWLNSLPRNEFLGLMFIGTPNEEDV